MNIIHTDPVIVHFVGLAQKYCDLIELGKHRPTLLRELAWLLPEIMAAVQRLPIVPPVERIRQELLLVRYDLDGVFPMTSKDRRRARSCPFRNSVISTKRFFFVSRRLGRLLGKFDRYREVFDPYRDKDSIETTLSNDLADIWHDLVESLRLFQSGNAVAMRHAVHAWSASARLDWGRTHLPNALKAVLFALEGDDRWSFPESRKRMSRRQKR